MPKRFGGIIRKMNADVTIVLATYNGADFLEAQLDSLLAQSYNRWKVLAHDDGSTDGTTSILKRYALKYPQRFTLLEDGLHFGSASDNFSHLLGQCDAEYIMFCDQDDVWRHDKIEISLSKMKTMENDHPDAPLLVHTDLEVVDEGLHRIDGSFWHYGRLDPSQNAFRRLLMQNVITGCTVMINRRLREKAVPVPNGAIMHDWWLGLVAARFGAIGHVQKPTIAYRQHAANDTGASRFGFTEVVTRAWHDWNASVLRLQMGRNCAQAGAFAQRFAAELSAAEHTMLTEFAGLMSLPFWRRRRVLLRYGLLKQGVIRNTGLLTRV